MDDSVLRPQSRLPRKRQLISLVFLTCLPLGCQENEASLVDTTSDRGRELSAIDEPNPATEQVTVRFIVQATERVTAQATERVTERATERVSNIAEASVADLQVRVVYGGIPPEPRMIGNAFDGEAAFCGDPAMIDESLLVDPDNRGIENVVLRWDSSPAGQPADSRTAGDETVIEIRDCRMTPRVTIVSPGESITLSNQDVFGHIIQAGFFTNPYVAVGVPVSTQHSLETNEPEPAAVPVTSQQFPWMQSYVWVHDRGLIDVSDRSGTIDLRDLPVGQTLTMRLWHESARPNSISLDGKTTSIRRGRFEVPPLVSGLNRLEIRIDADQFQRPGI